MSPGGRWLLISWKETLAPAHYGYRQQPDAAIDAERSELLTSERERSAFPPEASQQRPARALMTSARASAEISRLSAISRTHSRRRLVATHLAKSSRDGAGRATRNGAGSSR